MTDRADVIVVGAGLAGLGCALRLRDAGISPLILESSDGVGGRVRTDRLEGFQLDRGFQTLFEAYPEARRALDYKGLQLHRFSPSALVRFRGRFHRVSDPFRKPWDVIETALSPLASLPDKLRVARVSLRLMRKPVDEILRSPQLTTYEWLKRSGFSETIMRRLFVPFIGGIFLERELRTSSAIFEFVFKMMSVGNSSLPAAGMGAIPEQLASRLPEKSIRLNARVVRIEGRTVRLASGVDLQAKAIVVAADNPSAARLLPGLQVMRPRGVSCVYFASERSPVGEPVILLDGDGCGPVNNLCVLSDVAPSYSPPGASLISAAILDNGLGEEQALLEAARRQLRDWFGGEALRWRHLRTCRIPFAQPEEATLPTRKPAGSPRIQRGLYVCGDYREMASINGALLSGRRAAECAIEDLA